jgi:Pentapeptide repeats (9 copies)
VPSHEESLVARFVETHPTFELQHRSTAAGSEWMTIASSLNKPSYSFSPPAKPEEEGIWSYRVRSRTVVPAFDLEPEEVIVTPWSEILSNVLVTKRSNLHGANLEGVNLEGDNLPEANLKGANLKGANLQKANLQGANLNGVNASGANFAGANLEGANLNKANLTDASLDGANTKGANLNKITWSNTICPDGSNSNGDGGTCVNNLS